MDLRARHLLPGALLVAMALLGGCGSGSDDAASSTSTTTRPAGAELSDDDAERLATVLFNNYARGGATVDLSFDYSDQLTVAIEGTVDWKQHTGVLTVTTTPTDGSAPEVQEVAFTEDQVLARTSPEQAAEYEALGLGTVDWLTRPPDVANRPVDKVIDLLVSLAATRADNPRLLVQGEGTFEGTEEIGGVTVDTYSTGDARYWVDDDGLLRRFQGTLPGFSGPVVVDLADHGPVDVEVPTGAGVVEEAQLSGD